MNTTSRYDDEACGGMARKHERHSHSTQSDETSSTEQAFSTVRLSFNGWLHSTAVAGSVLWLNEVAKSIICSTAKRALATIFHATS